MTALSTQPMQAPGRLLSLADVEKETSLSKSTIRRRIREDKFPAPIPLGSNRVAWVERDIEEWKIATIEAART